MAPHLRLLSSNGSNEGSLPRGSIRARQWTRPLRQLTPETSYGFRVIWFASHVLGMPLDPWQQWLVIHLGELLEDGRPRFRQALVLVARQNGKTHLCVVLALYWLFVERWPMVFGTSTNLEQAEEPWQAAADMTRDVEALAALMPQDANRGVRKANGQQTITTTYRTRYKIGAVGPRGGRGKSIDRQIGDELREHKNWEGYKAAYNAMTARPHGQAVYITNQGDDTSVVLNSLFDAAIKYLETGEGDYRIGVFDYSAPPGCALDDPAALAQANPNVGHVRANGQLAMDWETLLGPARRLSLPGADPAEVAGFRTETLCQRVQNLDAAIDPIKWAAGVVDNDLSDLRARLAMVVDISPDRQRVTAVVGALRPDGRVQVEVPEVDGVVASWTGPMAVAQMQRQLPAMVRKIKPQLFGWIPGGPAAAASATLKERKGRVKWPPPGVQVKEITDEVTAVCMGLASEVDADQVVHNDDPLLNAQITGAAKLWQGDRWRFERKGGGSCEAAYAVAGVVHLARTLPKSIGRPRIVKPAVRA